MTRVRERTPRLPRYLSVGLRALIVIAAALWSASPALANENFQTVDGLAVYLGLIPAAMVAGHAAGHEEATMHGGVPTGGHQYHLVVAVFDNETGERIDNAEVLAVVSGLGHVGGTTIRLEPMPIENTVTYGAYADLRSLDQFDIALTIKVPGRPSDSKVIFSNEHAP